MGNSTASIPDYSCFDANLSRTNVTVEYWDTHGINMDYRIGSFITGIVMAIFVLIGLPANVILIFGLVYKRLYKDPTHILLLNLAISDFLVCLLVMPPTIVSGAAGGFIFGRSDYTRCQICQLGLVNVALTVFSVNILGLISLDRFIFIRVPLHYNKIVTTPRIMIAIGILWLMSIAESILPLVGFGEIRYAFSVSTCQPYLLGETDFAANVYYVGLIIILCSLPALGMIVTNTWIVIIVRSHLKKLYRTRSNTDGRELEKHEQKLRRVMQNQMNKKHIVLIRVFGAILLAHIITWSPITFHTVILSVYTGDLPLGLYIFVYLSFISHSVLHPLIEGYFIPEVKAIFDTIFFKRQISKKLQQYRTSEPVEKVLAELTEIDQKTGLKCCDNRCLDICSLALLPESLQIQASSSSD